MTTNMLTENKQMASSSPRRDFFTQNSSQQSSGQSARRDNRKQTPVAAAATPPGKASPFYQFLAALEKVSQVKNQLVLFDDFKAPQFEQTDVRIANDFDCETSAFFPGRVREYNERSGYGFILSTVPGVSQSEFYFHASGFETPVVEVYPPSDAVPYTLVRISGQKSGRSPKSSRTYAGKTREVSLHILPYQPQRDEAVSFSPFNDPRKHNVCAGRWLPRWIYDRIAEVAAVMTSHALNLIPKYSIVLLEEATGKEREVFRTNFPLQAVAGYNRISRMLGSGQELFIVDYKNSDGLERINEPLPPANVRWNNSHPILRVASSLTKYISDKAASLDVDKLLAGS